jgi:hypothetical protein
MQEIIEISVIKLYCCKLPNGVRGSGGILDTSDLKRKCDNRKELYNKKEIHIMQFLII